MVKVAHVDGSRERVMVAHVDGSRARLKVAQHMWMDQGQG